MARAIWPFAALFLILFAAPPASAQASLSRFSGLYWGAAVGWGEGSFSGRLGRDFTVPDAEADGLTGGLLFGAGWARGNALWGFEADLSRTVWQTRTLSDDNTRQIESDIEWIATLRGRYGRMATENWLIFGTAGLAYADASWTAETIGVDRQKIGIDTPGWVVGLGAERVLGTNWNGRVEALYYQFQNRADTSTLNTSSDPGDFARVDNAWMFRFGFIRTY